MSEQSTAYRPHLRHQEDLYLLPRSQWQRHAASCIHCALMSLHRFVGSAGLPRSLVKQRVGRIVPKTWARIEGHRRRAERLILVSSAEKQTCTRCAASHSLCSCAETMRDVSDSVQQDPQSFANRTGGDMPKSIARLFLGRHSFIFRKFISQPRAQSHFAALDEWETQVPASATLHAVATTR